MNKNHEIHCCHLMQIIEEVEKDIARMAKNLSEANSGGELESKKRTRVTL